MDYFTIYVLKLYCTEHITLPPFVEKKLPECKIWIGSDFVKISSSKKHKNVE